jgi:hypothetical protein
MYVRRSKEPVPQLDPTILKLLANGDVERANSVKESGPELSIFLTRDHGALLQIAGRPRKALQSLAPTLALEFRNFFIPWCSTAAPALDFSF